MNSKNISGTSSSIYIENDNINASWLTVTGDTVTANNNLYVGAVDVMTEINTKQDILDGTTDLTLKDLTTTGNITASGNVDISGNVTMDNTLTVTNDITSSAGDIVSTTGNVRGNSMTCDNALDTVDLNVTGKCDITGTRNTTEANEGVYIGSILTNDFGLNLVSNATGGSMLNFTKPNTAHLGSIDFDNTNNLMGFVISAVTQLTLDGTTADFQSNAINTTSNIISSAGTVQGQYMTCDQTLTTYDLDVNNNLVGFGDITANQIGALASFNTVQISDDLTVGVDLFVDESLNGVSVGSSLSTNVPQCALSVYGPFTTDIPTERGIHMSLKDDALALIQMCSGGGVNHPCMIEFSQPGYDYKGRLTYNHTNNDLNIEVENATVLNLTTTTANFQALDITTTGDITCNVLNHTGVFETTDIITDNLTVNTNLLLSGATLNSNSTITTTGTVNCNDLNITGSITGFSMQDVYNDNDVEPHIIINASHPVTFQGHASVTNTFQCRNPAGTNVFQVSRDGNITGNGTLNIVGDSNLGVINGDTLDINGASTFNGNVSAVGADITSNQNIYTTSDGDIYTNATGKIYSNTDLYGLGNVGAGTATPSEKLHVVGNALITGDLTVDTDTLHIDSTNNRVGIGTTTLESGFQIRNVAVLDAPTVDGLSLGMHNTLNPCVQLCALNNNFSFIDFTTANDTYEARIVHYNSSNTLSFWVNTSKPLDLTETDSTFDTDLIVTGDLTVDTNTFHVDSTNNRVGIGTASPDSVLHIVGPREGTPPSVGIRAGWTTSSDGYGLELCSGLTNSSIIDFTEPSQNRRGYIKYDNSAEIMTLGANNGDQMILRNAQVDCKDNDIVTTGKIGCGTISPLSALHVVGDRDNSPNAVGIHCGATGGGNDYGIEICSPANEQMLIDFCTNSGSNDYQTRLMYDDSNDEFSITTQNKGIVLDSGTDTIQLLGSTIVEPGKVFNANIDSTRGQIMSFIGEESGALATSAFDFRYGNGQVSSGSFGVCVPGDIKLKKWVYQNNNAGGTAFTTSTLIVFRVWSNGVGTGNYIYCDFSDTSRSNTTRRRCQGRFSSSSTSYVPVSNTITDSGDGAQISLETITLTGPGVTNNDHRMNLFVEILEDMD